MRERERENKKGAQNFLCVVVVAVAVFNTIILIYNMVFSGEEGFKGGASAPSLEREVSGMSFSAAKLNMYDPPMVMSDVYRLSVEITSNYYTSN